MSEPTAHKDLFNQRDQSQQSSHPTQPILVIEDSDARNTRDDQSPARDDSHVGQSPTAVKGARVSETQANSQVRFIDSLGGQQEFHAADAYMAKKPTDRTSEDSSRGSSLGNRTAATGTLKEALLHERGYQQTPLQPNSPTVVAVATDRVAERALASLASFTPSQPSSTTPLAPSTPSHSSFSPSVNSISQDASSASSSDQRQQAWHTRHTQQAPTEQDQEMSATRSFDRIISPPAHIFHASPSPVPTNPFRRSPSVSPPASASFLPTSDDLGRASGPGIDFVAEDPFSISRSASVASSTSSTPLPRSDAQTVPTEVVPVMPMPASTLVPAPPMLTSQSPVPSHSMQQTTVPIESSLGALSFGDQPPEYSQLEGARPPIPPRDPVALVTHDVSTAAPSSTLFQVTESTTTTTVPPTAPPVQTSPRQEEPKNEYVLKPIDWIDPATGIEKRIKIITQNENGPCPLLALCNTLILQGKVTIRPYDRPTIGYDHLLGLLADYLLNEDLTESSIPIPTLPTANGRVGERVENERAKSRLEIESALRLLPHLEHGLDVNVYFKTIRGFEPTAELSLFHTFGVELVHGWVVSPQFDVAMYQLMEGPAGITSYNKAVECIVSGDDAGGGSVVENESGLGAPINSSRHGQGSHANVSAHEAELRSERIGHVQEFIVDTKTQLTHYGLHVLQESLPEGHLCAFFRNNHFCTLFKNPMDGTLYTLVTDQSLAHEKSIVWESLVNVDGAGEFLDGLFRHGALEVGDYARNNQPPEAHSSHYNGGGDEDFALALQLQQQEEEEEARRAQRARGRNSLTPSQDNLTEAGQHRRQGDVSDSDPAVAADVFETDEQMAARLHQEFLAEQEREDQLRLLYQEQQRQQQRLSMQAQQRSQQYSQYLPPQQQQQQQYPGQGYPNMTTAGVQQLEAEASPYSGPSNGARPVPPPKTPHQQSRNNRNRNSSEGGERKDNKGNGDKCIIQ
ncbi:hypothetical protein BGW38_007633 [Lunasporangiospora selenospora]|uniref:MINDY deubiquitinase domain-containing protein n=1 Tax=Lunasporangiospora selenospora TaxID=979761 RepID=A0A9P6FYS7_9FUNG|nr:hypothetical protein BGW38_007633 [Lunasporangiospora selenospora]